MCERVALPGGGTAIICGGHGRGGRRRSLPCYYCPKPHAVLCDAPLPGGATCDRPCCRAHAKAIGADRDLCRDHALAAAKLEREARR